MSSIFNEEWMCDKLDNLSSLQYEENLIGGLISRSSIETFTKLYASICDTLSAEHFSNTFLSEVYKAIGEIAGKNEHATPISTCKQLGLDPISESGKYLVSLCRPTMVGKEVAFAIYDLAKKKSLFKFMEEKLDCIVEDDSEKLFKECKTFFGESDILSETNQFLSANALIGEIYDGLDLPKTRYSSGIPDLDYATGGGFYPSKCYTFAARKKMGKTILAGTIASNLVEAGVKTLFLAGEMSPKEIYQRMVARRIGRNSLCFLEQPDYKLREAMLEQKKINQANLTFLACPGITFEELRRKLYTAVNRFGVKVFILDYIQLVAGQKRGDSFASHMDAVAQWLADFCRKEDVVGIIIAQLNQENGNIRGGEGIRLAADQVYQLDKSQDENYYLNMMDSRYTKYADIGKETIGGLVMDMNGPHFRQV